MKKLLLLAVLLGLTGCGDNNQSDTTQTNTQASTLLKSEAVPTIANYSLAASPRAMSAVAPLQGWSITQSFIEGASTLINAIKDSKVSDALVTPNAKQVAEVLRGGAAGVALNIAVDQLLGAVDWVMDPENSQIKYKVPLDPNQIPQSWCLASVGCFDSISEAAESVFEYNNSLYPNDPYLAHRYTTSISGKTLTVHLYNKDGRLINIFTFGFVNNPNFNPNKTLPLEVVAEQVISNADAGSLDAQVATNIATQNILNDEELAKPVVQELENNAKDNCPSGITNNGSCWVCSKESWMPIRSRVVYAKQVVFGLKKCSVAMNSSQLLTRYKAYSELGAARDVENVCWSPQDSEHLEKAIDAKKVARNCNEYLGLLGN